MIRLTVLLACTALATSRLGLLAHELVGHGGAAIAVGTRVYEVQLFWFAGGWIRYEPVSTLGAAIAISMAGIAVELAAGTALWLFVRGDTLSRRLVRGVGAALVVHGGWYLATGAWHGFGDGALLYRALGDWRAAVAIPAGVVTCAAAYGGARVVLGALAGTLRGGRRARIAGLGTAVVVAAGLHVALAAGELAVRRDPTYTATMRPERERVIAREVARWDAEHEHAEPAARQAVVKRIEDEHRSFPFAWLLAAATLVSVIAGAWRTRSAPPQALASRTILISALVAAAAIAAVIVAGAL